MTFCDNSRPAAQTENQEHARRPTSQHTPGQRQGEAGRSVQHGMRNSLNTLKGALTVLLEKYPSDPYLREFLTIMEGEIGRLAGLIDSLKQEDRE